MLDTRVLMPAEPRSDGEQALIHLAWLLSGKKRKLVFGWVEIFPACFPPMPGHPYRHFQAKRDGSRLYVARFPLRASSALTWFSLAASGVVELPSHPKKASPGDGKRVDVPAFVREPNDGGYSTAKFLPFLPCTQGTVIAQGLFGEVAEDVLDELTNAASAEWLKNNLFFDLVTNREFLGGVFCTTRQPVVRDVGSRLSKNDFGEIELVRIRRWPATNLAGHRIFAIEQRTLGYGAPVEQPVRDSLTRVLRGPKQEKTAVALLHPQHGVCWFREPLPWLRTIVTELQMVQETRRIIQDTDGDGVATRFYDVPWHGVSNMRTIAGDLPDETAPSVCHEHARMLRRQAELADDLGLRWFDDPLTAQTAVRRIVGGARKYVTIFDRYFGSVDVRDFVMAVRSPDVKVTVVTSSEGLSGQMRSPAIGPSDLGMQQLLSQVTADGLLKVEILVMSGAKELHDRFIVSDGRVWLSGNSFNAIGSKASVLIEVPNSEEIHRHLLSFSDRAKPFDHWLSERVAARDTNLDKLSGAQPSSNK